MILIIGGFAQGKLHYVKQHYGEQKYIVNHLHLFIREQLQQGKKPEDEIYKMIEEHPDCILICDEIGNGIVPMEAEERTYRERTGRILERLAAEADEVVRVVCGIGQKIK